MKKKLKPLIEFVTDDCDNNVAEAARRLKQDYLKVRGWLRGKHRASKDARKLMALRGIGLP